MQTPDDVIESSLAALDLATKVSLLTGRDFWRLPPVRSIGLRSIVLSDGPIGVRGIHWDPTDPSLALPSPSALAATWDAELARSAGRALGREARRRGVDVLLAPTVNLHRSPLGGRHFECYSEDPFLTGEIGASYVAGVQETGVGATVKHFVANDSETDRMTVDVQVSERALRELYLAPFETILRRAEPWAVMAAYNSVNGQTMTENLHLVRDVLKAEWGFDGVVMSDWTAARSTVESAVAGLDLVMPAWRSPWGEALVEAVTDGRVPESVVDEAVRRVLRLAARVGALSKVKPPEPRLDGPAGTAVAKQIAIRSFVLARNDGTLPLDRARLNRIALIGALAGDARVLGGGSAEVTPPYVVSPKEALTAVLPPHIELTHHIGADPRRNLPAAQGDFRVRLLDAKGKELAATNVPEARAHWFGDPPPGVNPKRLSQIELTGTITPTVDGEHSFAVYGNGDFTFTVDGAAAESGTVPMTAGQPVEVAVTQQVVREHDFPAFVSLVLGYAPPRPDPDELIEQAVRAAAEAEVAVVVVGTTAEDEAEGSDRTTLALPGRQDELVSRVAAANLRTVVVVNAGSPVLLPWLADVAAVLLAWFPGQECGHALADVLLGVAEPGGRLPTTWPRAEADCPVLSTTPVDGVLAYDEGVFIGYRAWDRRDVAPMFPFGHGFGYTSWEYEAIALEPGPGLGTVHVQLRNVGRRAGREVVQVYLGPEKPDESRPRRWLAGFAIAEAVPDEAVTLTVPLPLRAAQVWDSDASRWRTVPGSYSIEAGHSSAELRLYAKLQV